jgi:hypothetical protein
MMDSREPRPIIHYFRHFQFRVQVKGAEWV